MILNFSIPIILFFFFFSSFIINYTYTQSKHFTWKKWISHYEILSSGDILIREKQIINFNQNDFFTYGYRTIPIDYTGRNDGIDYDTIEVKEVIENNGKENMVIDYMKVKNQEYGRKWEKNFFYVKQMGNNELGIFFQFPKTNGEHVYEIVYKMKKCIRKIDDDDDEGGVYELFWKVLPPMHPAEVEYMKVTVEFEDYKKMVKDVKLSKMIVGDMVIPKSQSETENVFVFEYLRTIPNDEMAEIQIRFGSEYVFKNEWSDYLTRGDFISLLVLIGCILTLALPFFIKYRFYSVKLKTKVPDILYSPNFEDLTVSEVGHMYKNGSDIKLIIAQMVQIAIKGHLEIIDEGNDYTYRFKRCKKENCQPLEPHEAELLEYIFDSSNEIYLASLKYKFSKHLHDYYNNIDRMLVSKGYRSQKISIMRTLNMVLLIASVVLIIIFWAVLSPFDYYWKIFGTPPFYFGPFNYVLLLVSCVIGMIFTFTLYNTNTEKGEKVARKCKSFRKYMKNIEKSNKPDSRLHKELFEKYLPFAILFGLEDKWSKTFGPILKAKASTSHSSGCYHSSCYYGYQNDYFYYSPWYGYRWNRGYNSTRTRNHHTSTPTSRTPTFPNETFTSRLSRMLSSSSTIFSSVEPSKSSSSSGSGRSSSSSGSGGGGSAGFG